MAFRGWVIIAIILLMGIFGCAHFEITQNRPQRSSFLEVSIFTPGRIETEATNTNTPLYPIETLPLTPTATNTPPPTLTDTPISPVIPTDINTPTATSTSTPTLSRPVIGGTDKIAYLNSNEIWIADLDGSHLTQLSFDGRPKSNLQWSPDGQAIIYIFPENKCVYSISIEDKVEEWITCFTFANYFRAFEISPDGKKVAISVDNLLYVLPYDRGMLQSIEKHGHLSANAVCEYYDPLQNEPDQVDPTKNVIAKFVHWSRDNQRLAFVTHGWQQDIIRFIEYNDCVSEPETITTFYPDFFLPSPELYKKNPVISNFGWNGDNLVSMVAVADRETGFGTLYIYDSRVKKAYGPYKGISSCCYRDPTFSADGSYLAFAYKEYSEQNPSLFYDLDSDIKIYVIPNPLYSEFSSQDDHSSLPLPLIDPLSHPQGILRPVIVTPTY